VTRWTAFAGVAGTVLFLVLLLARASQSYVSDDTEASESGVPRGDPPEVSPDETPGSSATSPEATPPASDPPDPGRIVDPEGSADAFPRSREVGPRDRSTGESVEEVPLPRPATPESRVRDPASTATLLANVTVSQGFFLVVLVVAAWLTAVPPSALGIAWPGATELAAGTALGVVLYGTNEVGSVLAERVGIDQDESLREMLAPDSTGQWLVLLFVVLPVIAGFEELLFRATLVGAVPAGFGVSPWVMVGFSSVAFGVGHGAQGPAGIAVTTALGAVLATAFVLTGSLLAVVLAHYLVNALEFVVHEGVGVDPAEFVG
jgi:membrane protease YdiL (CAAX protease family)